MKNKEKYYKLDDVGIVGKQENKSPASQVYHKKRTGAAIRELRAKAKAPRSYAKKVASQPLL